MRVGAARCLLFAQSHVEQGGQLGKTLQTQTTADSKQTVVQILAVLLPALTLPLSVSEIVVHAHKILFAQPLQP